MSTADEIREALKADERNSTEIGKLADIHPVTIRQFKAGLRSLPLGTLERLAEVLGYKITVKKSAEIGSLAA